MTVDQWPRPFFAFFDALGLSLITDALQHDLLTFSSSQHLTVLVEELSRLQSAIASFVDQHPRPATNSPMDHDKALPERRPASEADLDSATNPVLKQRKLDMVQVQANRDSIDQRIAYFKHLKRHEINESNQQEYFQHAQVDDDPNPISCARVDLSGVNRAIQMKQQVANNEDGPIMRSIAYDSKRPKDPTVLSDSECQHSGLVERVGNLEAHLKIVPNARPKSTLVERIKAVENTIMGLEREFPKQAQRWFQPPDWDDTGVTGSHSQLPAESATATAASK
ncbi:hypothetical protein H4R35_006140 [Dimargaris xerosporica]|nr:hypothetical protein H4R35_006140 [Dimargaris xerosporica]